jgi:squalene synthase HpnC
MLSPKPHPASRLSHYSHSVFLLPVPVDHYENFPVASWLLPKRLRRPVEAIYRFARTRTTSPTKAMRPRRRVCSSWRPTTPNWIASNAAKHRPIRCSGRLPPPSAITPFRSHRSATCLSAFAQDVEKKRYASFGEVMDYCRRSANPVGRLMLHLYGDHDPRHLAYSDAICSSLQLINFLQDIAVDYRKDRIYLPQDELAAYHVSETQIAEGDTRGLWHMMMHKQIERTRKLLQAGAPLGRLLKGRIGLELRVTILGGEAILRKLHADPGCVFHNRPVLTKKDWIFMLGRGLF